MLPKRSSSSQEAFGRFQFNRHEASRNNTSSSVHRQRATTPLPMGNVILEKTVCYLSNFDLAIEQWTPVQDSIKSFQTRMPIQLGHMWFMWIQEITKQTVRPPDDVIQQTQFEIALSAYFLHCYSEQNLPLTLEPFKFETISRLQQAGFHVVDLSAYNQLMESFFQVGAALEQTIVKEDQPKQQKQFQLQITDDSGRSQIHASNIPVQPYATMETKRLTHFNSSYGQFSSYVPSLQFIRNAVIKPLLFATEKVVEQLIPPQPQRLLNGMSDISVSNFSSYGQGQPVNIKRIDTQQTRTSLVTQTSTLSKRTFKQLNRNWDLHLETSDADTLVANQHSGSQKRQIKLERKLISKICRYIAQNKGVGKLQAQGLKQKETVTACFSTLIYDMDKEYMSQFAEAPIEYEQVDSVRLIKTNPEFYTKIITLFLKYRIAYPSLLQDQTTDFCSYVNQRIQTKQQTQKVITFTSSLLCGLVFQSKVQTSQQLFSALVQQLECVWEQEVVQKSQQFK